MVIDLETTGLRTSQDKILEFGAVRVCGEEITDTFARLVRLETSVPPDITALTGIDDALVERQGVPLKEALTEFLEFVGQDVLVGYHLAFDLAFLREACLALKIRPPTNRCTDLLSVARRKVFDVPDFKLETLARHFSLDTPVPHRALRDCQILVALQKKLKEN